MQRLYIVLPAGYKSGGPELGHQLAAYYAKNSGLQVFAAYIGVKPGISPVNEAFKKYAVEWVKADEIVDDTESVVIFPETMVSRLSDYKNVKKIIWWMSVDNYLVNSYVGANIKLFVKDYSLGNFKNLLRIVKRFLCAPRNKFRRSRRNAFDADLHLYQSEYARQYLESRNIIENVMPLSDYINDSYFSVQHDYSSINRQDIVLYNPKKGYKFTRKLMKKAPDLKWTPIQNMTTEQVVELLNKSKVYIDFGNHPGKDRFPREAAISSCCVITGKRGSAGNDIDVSIPAEYKYDDKKENVDEIINKIKECLLDYDKHIDDFAAYRDKITKEKSVFFEEADRVLDVLQKL